jgi:O-acetylhomoserine (thiol)-lyase
MADHVYQPETLAIHAGQIPDAATGARALPIYQTTSFVFDSAEHAASLFNLQTFGNVYSRLSNPTVAALEERVAALEGGRAALACASGMAAEAIALMTLLQAGDHVVAAGALYGGSVSMMAVNLKKLGIETSFVDATLPDAFAAAMRPNTRAVFAESLGNPSLQVLDIEAVADVAHAHGVPLIVDNTVPSPFLCTPLRFGADIVVHSATKYLGGHGTTLGGVIVEGGKPISRRHGNFAWDNGKFPGMTEPSPGYHGVKFFETFGDFAFTMRARMETLRVYGAALAPMSAWQILQGMETLHLRMERHCTNARRVALFLRAHPQVAWVNYPGLADHEQHALAAKQFRSVDGAPGASGLLAFGVKPAVAGALAGAGAGNALAAGIRFIEAAQFMSHVANIGDTRTLVIHPASTTHRQLDDAQQLAAGVRPDMVRMSVGIEHIDDILWDIDQALAAASA